MALNLTKSKSIIATIQNSFNKYWLGNAANSAKSNIASLLLSSDNLVTVAVIEAHLKKIDNIENLKQAIIKNAEDYSFWYTEYERLKKAYQSSEEYYNEFVLNNALIKRKDAYKKLTTNISDLETKISDIYKKCDSTEPSYLQDNYIVYGINNGPTLLSGKLDELIVNLKIKRALLTAFKNDKVKLTFPDNSWYDIDISNARNHVVGMIDMFIKRVELIQNKFARHMEAIINFEAGETVYISYNGERVENKTEKREKTHVLGSGETLIYLESLYGVPWQEIAKANNIKDTRKIPDGAVLVIPGQYESFTVQPTENVEVVDNASLPDITPVSSNTITKFSEVGKSNWGVDAVPMKPGVYGSPLPLKDGKMVSITGNEVYVSCGVEGYDDHRGTDITEEGNRDVGTPINPVGPGVVVETYKTAVGLNAKVNNGYGNCVKVLHEVQDEDGNAYYILSIYEHLDTVPKDINVGDVIDDSTQIGTLGNTGDSNGAHLHLELTKVPFLKEEDLAGKDSDEIAELWREGNLANRDQGDGHWHYGRENWLDPANYYKNEQKSIDHWEDTPSLGIF